MSELEAKATAYEINAYPYEDVNTSVYAIKVEYRGRDLWAVKHMSSCFDADGRKEYESIPSERKDEWLARFRFDLDTALALARKVAPLVTVNGNTAGDIAAWTDSGCPCDENGYPKKVRA